MLAIVASPAFAGLIVLSGDATIGNALVGASTPVNAGNQRFFANVLAAGSRVLVQGDNGGPFESPVLNIDTFYRALPGVTSSVQSGPLTSASLAGVDLFVSATPLAPFALAEILALDAFAARGGTLLLLGDSAASSAARDANLNALLLALGSPLRLVPDTLDASFRVAGPGQIAIDPLTAGVTSLTYGFVSPVTGGRTLFTASDGQAFVAALDVPRAVPAPTTPALLAAAGLAPLLLSVFRPRGRRRD